LSQRKFGLASFRPIRQPHLALNFWRRFGPRFGQFMANREVRAVRLDEFGNVSALGNEESPWKRVSSEEAILDIETGRHKYFVQWPERRTVVMAVYGRHGKYLRTDRDFGPTNDLTALPRIESREETENVA
jgi:hypothetical protein